MTGWTTVVVETTVDGAELAADVLWRAGAAAIEEQDLGVGRVRLLAGYPTSEQAGLAAASARDDGWSVVRVEAVVDDGLDAWRAFAEPVRAGRVLLVPAWLDTPDHADGDLAVRLDPGPTFGSGSHPTTRLVAATAADLVRSGDTVLDVGAGSGVLSVIAALAGARSVTALDVDPASAPAVAANAAANGVAHLVGFDHRPLAEVAASGVAFDLVLANLLAPVVIDLARSLVSVLAPGGRLVVSGLLVDRWKTATDHLTGLVVDELGIDDDWVAVTLRHPGGDRTAP